MSQGPSVRGVSISNQLVLERSLPLNDAKHLVKDFETRHPSGFDLGAVSHLSLHRMVDGCPKMKLFQFMLGSPATRTNGLDVPLIIPIPIGIGEHLQHISGGAAGSAGGDEGGGDVQSGFDWGGFGDIF